MGGGILIFQNGNYFTKTDNFNKSRQKLLAQLDTKSLNQVIIKSQNSVVKLLQLQGGGWQEQTLNYEADINQIQALLVNISQIHMGDQVTDNPDHHERFHLLTPPQKVIDWNENLHGFSISLLRGDETSILSLLLGKERSNGPGQYFRHAGSNNVFLIPERLSVDFQAIDWLNKELLGFAPKQIKSLELQQGEQSSFSISRKNAEANWSSTSADLNVPDADSISKILERLGNLSFSKLQPKDYVYPEVEGTALAEFTLIVSLFKEQIYTLKLLNNLAPNGDYVLSLRMGISLQASASAIVEDSKLRLEMDAFNQRVNGRFFEISSWEGQELIPGDQ